MKSVSFLRFFLKNMMCLLLLLKVQSLNGVNEEASKENSLKILVLIIASDDSSVYRELQRIWKSYMHLDREHVEAYFIKGNAELPSLYKISGDTIWSRTAENYSPGILNKTVLSIEAILPRINEFDFVLRTNLSSFYVFPRLLEFVKTLPKEKCYCGFPWVDPAITFASGAGFIISCDLAELLVNRKAELLENSSHADDVLVGMLLKQEKIGLISAPRLDLSSLKKWKKHKRKIPEHQFHFRVKNRKEELRRIEEIHIQRKLVKLFYKIQL